MKIIFCRCISSPHAKHTHQYSHIHTPHALYINFSSQFNCIKSTTKKLNWCETYKENFSKTNKKGDDNKKIYLN